MTEPVAAIYAQVSAPEWAAPNLDGLADVLRDLSWLPPGPVSITVPPLDGVSPQRGRAVLAVLARAVDETVATERPVRLR